MTLEKTRSQIGTARIFRVSKLQAWCLVRVRETWSPQLSLKQLQTRLVRANKLR